MDSDDGTKKQCKIYKSATFLFHLLHLGHQNLLRTPAIFQAGILLLNIAFIFYIVGFVSPYWILGEKHKFRHDAWGNRLPGVDGVEGTGGNSSSSQRQQQQQQQGNATHFGVWKECLEVEGGGSVCTIFTEDVDSVVLMFGCVGGFILLGLCCWSCISCVRKPRKDRYVFIVIAATIGGLFGVLSVVIFVALQGFQQYSWAFALFLTGCLLEVLCAALFLWGIQRATARGAFPLTVEETEDTTTLPAIVLTGPTPSRKEQTRSVRVIHKGSSRDKGRGRGRGVEGREEDHVDFITLEMVTPAPGRPVEEGEGKKKKKRRRRGRKKKEDSGVSSTIEITSPVESLAQQVADYHKGYVNLRCPTPPPPRPPSDTKPPSSDASQSLFPATSQGMNRDQRPAASVYIDLSGKTHTLPFTHRACGDRPERSHTTAEQFGNKPSGRGTYGHGGGGGAECCSVRLVAEVHRPYDELDLLHPLSSTGKDPTADNFHLNPPARGHYTLQPLGPQPSPPFPSSRRTTADNVSVRGNPLTGTEGRRSSAESRAPYTASGGSGGVKGKRTDGEESQYVTYNPDTYYQSRGGAGYYV
ncbi:hypothetical protein ACOMHN_046352 [Nucella lapillus]